MKKIINIFENIFEEKYFAELLNHALLSLNSKANVHLLLFLVAIIQVDLAISLCDYK